MQISHDFITRKSPFAQRPPARRELLDDDMARRIFGTLGAHQKCLDMSRCSRVRDPETFACLLKCKALMYLDLSFSNFLDMNHLMELHHLKSLLLGGVRVNDFSFLKYFDKLEVLSVRNCLGFHDLKDINTMSTLRSLDIGHCQKICTILDIKQLTRLEELILDSTGITSARHVPDVLDVIKDFKLLRLLNVGNTILTNHRQAILDVMRQDSVLEADSRDTLFLKAAINNDVDMLRWYVGSGIDINIRASTEISQYLFDLWLNKLEGSTGFVMVGHEDEILRPTALHLAILFNSIEAVELLCYAGADVDLYCFFSDVKLVDGNVFIWDEEKTTFNAEVKKIENPRYVMTTEVNCLDLIESTFEQNIVRLASGLKKDKIMNWKEIARYSHMKLVSIVGGSIDEKTDEFLTGSPPPYSRSETRTEEGQAIIKQHQRLMRLKMGAIEDESILSSASKTSSKKKVKNKEDDESLVSIEEQDDRTIDSHVKDKQGDGEDDDEDDYTVGTMVESVLSLRGEIRAIKSGPGVGGLRNFIPYKGQCHWRDLPMVRKVAGKPLLLPPTRPRSDEPTLSEKIRVHKMDHTVKSQVEIEEERRLAGLVSILGERSYWLHSAKIATEERQKKEQAAFDALQTKPSLYRTIDPLDKELHEVPIIERRDKFYENLEKERIKRTAIRFLEEELGDSAQLAVEDEGEKDQKKEDED